MSAPLVPSFVLLVSELTFEPLASTRSSSGKYTERQVNFSRRGVKVGDRSLSGHVEVGRTFQAIRATASSGSLGEGGGTQVDST